jgi:hypothetical protein
MDPHADLHARIAGLCRRTEDDGTPGLAEAMNDLLSEGYARALLEERRIGEIEERVVELLMSSAERDELRSLTAERRAASLAVERLRAELAAMHDRYVALRAG